MRIGNRRWSRVAVAALFAGAGWRAIQAGAAVDAGPLAAHRNPVPADSRSVAHGRALYGGHCASCHGPGGKGDGHAGQDLDPAPSDLTCADVAEMTDWELFRKITRGRRPMPSFERLIAERDRWDVVNYLRTLSREAHSNPQTAGAR